MTVQFLLLSTYRWGKPLLYGWGEHDGRDDEHKHEEGHVEQSRGDRVLHLGPTAAQAARGRTTTTAQ